MLRHTQPVMAFSNLRPLRQEDQSELRAEQVVQRDEYEQAIYTKLEESLTPEFLDVRDISGGCGSMFAITVVSDKFKGIPMIKQHRLVNEVLKEDIKNWHGVQLRTQPTDK
ncbi:hypothetical protein TRICI_006479 [Trichomonascus ciferrii]|uniref:Bola-like protein n=1 Tax=Trichomonascus ciferrii TaxID=44093 RepID=A0A642UGU9_9ASCO|nr:hypothetical protein TRICI_006479 [Trichomonascus ciferrii]